MTVEPEHYEGKWPFTRPEGSEASMFIQWKGTDVCMDFVCQCGADPHLDSGFAYAIGCPACGAIYELGTQVIAKRVDPGSDGARVVRWAEMHGDDGLPIPNPPGRTNP